MCTAPLPIWSSTREVGVASNMMHSITRVRPQQRTARLPPNASAIIVVGGGRCRVGVTTSGLNSTGWNSGRQGAAWWKRELHPRASTTWMRNHERTTARASIQVRSPQAPGVSTPRGHTRGSPRRDSSRSGFGVGCGSSIPPQGAVPCRLAVAGSGAMHIDTTPSVIR